MMTKNILQIFITLFLFYNSLAFGVDYVNKQDSQLILTISPQIALPIGIKIWFNESGGSIMGLTAWNHGENFASLGIGHFLWHPYGNGRRASFDSGFPSLVRYIKKRGGYTVPSWLHGALYCPWSTRQEFLQNQHSPRMTELRLFLQQTIPVQAEYMVRNLEEILPELLASAHPNDRAFIYNKFYTLARTPAGIYALVDFLNFKGAGVSESRHSYERGSGLLHVLKDMKHAPPGSTPLQAYVWSAKNALIRRVEQSSPSAHTERWLSGWLKRVNTYLLDGNYLGTQLAMNNGL